MSEEIDKLLANSERVICNECQSQGLKSAVQDCGSTSTMLACMPFYDEEGKHHYHNYNRVTTSFKCSNNHRFTKQRLNGCWCGWKQEAK